MVVSYAATLPICWVFFVVTDLSVLLLPLLAETKARGGLRPLLESLTGYGRVVYEARAHHRGSDKTCIIRTGIHSSPFSTCSKRTLMEASRVDQFGVTPGDQD